MVLLECKIENERFLKPFSGRYKVTRIEYVDAASQTEPKRMLWENTCSRAVQHVQTKNEATQSLRHRATQMWRDDCYIPNEADKYMTAKPYETYVEMRFKLDKYARIIQRNYRVYRMRKYVKECARIYRDKLEKCEKYEEEKTTAYKLPNNLCVIREVTLCAIAFIIYIIFLIIEMILLGCIGCTLIKMFTS